MIGAVDQSAGRARQLRKVLAIMPTSGNRAFGVQRTPDHVHQGVDLALPKGTTLYSPVDGTVTHASDVLEPGFSGYGRHVVIRQGDDGPWLLFGHLDEVHTEPGEELLFGDDLGTVGDSCFDKSDPSRVCDGAHVHFEASPGSYPQDSEAERLDPVAWLQSEIDGVADTAPESSPTTPARARKRKPARGLRGFGVLIGVGAVIGFLIALAKQR